jgi:hypothetical protein
MTNFNAMLSLLSKALSAKISLWGYSFNLMSVWVFSALAGLVAWFINNFRGGDD